MEQQHQFIKAIINIKNFCLVWLDTVKHLTIEIESTKLAVNSLSNAQIRIRVVYNNYKKWVNVDKVT